MKIELKNISAGYGKKLVLNSINHTFESGKIHGIIGANGSGKSTLVKVIAGLISAQAGKILVNGRELKSWSKRELAKELAIVAQNPHTPEEITVEELVMLGRYPHQRWGFSYSKLDREIANHAMLECHVEEFKHTPLTQLSGGERQRVWLALALTQQPKILILDEPNAFLDWHARLELSQLLRESGLTIIMVLHDLNEALRSCDTITALKNHQILLSGESKTILNEQNIEQIFGVSTTQNIASDGVPFFVPEQKK